jgi:predicted type IV restriction endonuclease
VEEDLLDIRAGIKAGRYVNEATVSQGIVQRLLNILGWPVYNTEVVAPGVLAWLPEGRLRAVPPAA